MPGWLKEEFAVDVREALSEVGICAPNNGHEPRTANHP